MSLFGHPWKSNYFFWAHGGAESFWARPVGPGPIGPGPLDFVFLSINETLDSFRFSDGRSVPGFHFRGNEFNEKRVKTLYLQGFWLRE